MISKSEAEIVNKAHKDVLELTDKKSRDKLKHIMQRMNNNEKMIIDDPYNEGAFMLTSHSESDFEVLYSHDFHVGMKMGLYIEIFYSPFDDEVLELYLGERYDSLKEQADTSDEYDNEDKGNLNRFLMNKYKASK